MNGSAGCRGTGLSAGQPPQLGRALHQNLSPSPAALSPPLPPPGAARRSATCRAWRWRAWTASTCCSSPPAATSAASSSGRSQRWRSSTPSSVSACVWAVGGWCRCWACSLPACSVSAGSSPVYFIRSGSLGPPPPPSSPLWDRRNVLLTPHSSAISQEYIDLFIQEWLATINAANRNHA